MTFIYEGDNWTTEGKNFLTKEIAELINRELQEGVLIVQHWFYRGATSPNRLFFEDYINFEEYLKNNSNPGDIIEVWSFNKVCCSQNLLAEGKIPDDKGRVPLKGPY